MHTSITQKNVELTNCDTILKQKNSNDNMKCLKWTDASSKVGGDDTDDSFSGAGNVQSFVFTNVGQIQFWNKKCQDDE